MKYLLKRDLPLAKAGTEVIIPEESKYGFTLYMYDSKTEQEIAKILEKDIPEWLEEVKEPKTIYDLKKGDEIWVIHGRDVIKNEAFAFAPYAHINVFLTEREAKRNKLLRELATREKWLPMQGDLYSTYGQDNHTYKNQWDGGNIDTILYHEGLIFRNEEEYNKYITPEAKDLLFKL